MDIIKTDKKLLQSNGTCIKIHNRIKKYAKTERVINFPTMTIHRIRYMNIMRMQSLTGSTLVS